VIVEPPLEVGALHETTAEPEPAVALTDPGAPGTSAVVTTGDGADGVLTPNPLSAVTLNV
jgi:hypothetical protein